MIGSLKKRTQRAQRKTNGGIYFAGVSAKRAYVAPILTGKGVNLGALGG